MSGGSGGAVGGGDGRGRRRWRFPAVGALRSLSLPSARAPSPGRPRGAVVTSQAFCDRLCGRGVGTEGEGRRRERDGRLCGGDERGERGKRAQSFVPLFAHSSSTPTHTRSFTPLHTLRPQRKQQWPSPAPTSPSRVRRERGAESKDDDEDTPPPQQCRDFSFSRARRDAIAGPPGPRRSPDASLPPASPPPAKHHSHRPPRGPRARRYVLSRLFLPLSPLSPPREEPLWPSPAPSRPQGPRSACCTSVARPWTARSLWGRPQGRGARDERGFKSKGQEGAVGDPTAPPPLTPPRASLSLS